MSTYAAQLQSLHNAMVRGRTEHMLPFIKPTRHNTFAPHMRLAVYADGYHIRLIEAIISDYPALEHYMGDIHCRSAVDAFVRTAPSSYWDLNRYPVFFAQFLKSHSGDKAVHALAKLESAITEVFWLPESAPLTPARLAGLSEEEFGNRRFHLRTAARLLKLNFAANEYLTAFRAGDSAEFLKERAEHLLIIRVEYEVRRLILEPLEYTLLAAINEGGTFNDALSSIQNHEALAENLPNYIARWMEYGVFSEY